MLWILAGILILFGAGWTVGGLPARTLGLVLVVPAIVESYIWVWRARRARNALSKRPEVPFDWKGPEARAYSRELDEHLQHLREARERGEEV